MDFILIKNTKVYSDCSFDSNELFEIPKNTTLHKLYSNGPWLRVKYNDTLSWLYPFDKNKLIINPINPNKQKREDTQLRIGTVVYIKPNKPENKYLDRNGKLFNIADDDKRKFFVIDSVKTVDNYYKVKDGLGNYYFIDEADLDLSINDETMALVSNFFDLQLFADDSTSDAKKTETTETPYALKEELTDFKEYGKVLMDAYNERVSTKYKNQVNLTKINLTNLRTVFGMPYQYMPSADLRANPDGTLPGTSGSLGSLQDIGMKYREKILSRMPMLVMMPGIVNFMPNYSYQAKETALKEILTQSETYTNNKAFDFLVNSQAKTRSSYYTFYPAWTEYFNYVNKMCSVAAVFMGLADVRLPYSTGGLGTLGDYRWQNALPSSLSSTFYKGSCAFYVNTDTSINDTYSNSTTQSQLASKVNEVSDKARELAFLSGGASDAAAMLGNVASTIGTTTVAGAGEKLSQGMANIAAGKYSSEFAKTGVLSAIMGGISNACSGAKMQFPELWQDSAFSRDYTITIKLDSPDNDPLSVFLNIIVPLIHLTAFAAPRSTGLTTYASPFLVRAYYQGFFNVNMGIISSMSINKGAEGAWTYNNIPTTVEVQVNIHDLFATQTISISANNNSNSLDSLANLDMLTNQPLMEYLANMCGVNYNEPEWNRLIDLAVTLQQRKVPDLFARIEDAIIQGINYYTNNIYSTAINSNHYSLFNLAYQGTVGKVAENIRQQI